ncbi:Maf family protein [Botrimarina hoheduenensis]|uniref:dTTP/UTP pyrophosphatase n=1 Tax=Botrimarina hoheduenensis TaxID=2528000 RepID=A0A5C5VV96_9BACT|nr:Maf family protein [Botrimarina hoheduenensis]TWT42576.1 Maf-like protein YhdE [Botrimarina hoheduenensis]
MCSPQLILASASPRRRELLEAAGYAFQVVSPREGAEPEGACSACGPAQLVVDLAVAKLRDVLDQLRLKGAQADPRPTTLVLAADTVAECGGQVLGKPRNEDHAVAMMRMLSGTEHRVYTGVALATLTSRGQPYAEAVITTLRMNDLSEAWIANYAESGAWEGKAGGFGYQDGLGFVHVVAGSESNVVGLPMERVAELLADRGVHPSLKSTL